MGDTQAQRQGSLPSRRRASSARYDVSGRTLGVVASGRSEALDPRAVLQLQRAGGNTAVAALLGSRRDTGAPAVRDVVGSGRGSPLDHALRARMEKALGQDFSGVRLHTGPAATASARSLNAHAYTSGDDIVFQGWAFNPHTSAGRRMLAHELTHVVQQRSGPVSGVPVAGGIAISDPADRFERNAERVAAQLPGSADVSGPALEP